MMQDAPEYLLNFELLLLVYHIYLLIFYVIFRFDMKFEKKALQELSENSHGASGCDLNNFVLSLWISCHQLPAVTLQHIMPVLEDFRNLNTDQTSQSNRTKTVNSKIQVLGYSDEYTYLERMINMSLKYGDVYEKQHLAAPTRYLLYGPPGCGKTHLTQALAAKFSLAIRKVTRADVFSKYFGESEVKLNNIFDEVSNV